MKFYRCEDECKFWIFLGENAEEMCKPNEKLKELVPGETDGASEKHVPVYKQEGNKFIVHVGEIEHPMLEEHFIAWIFVETNTGFHCKKLKPFDGTKAEFIFEEGEKPICVYEYCNLHGLWKAVVQ